MVEGAVEGDGSAFGGIYQAAGGLDVDVSVLAEASEYQSVGSCAACHADVFQHRFHFYGRIEEVSSAGADDDVQADVEQAACHCDFAIRGGGPSFGDACA